MSIHKIVKQKLLSEPFKGDSLKLMKAIYNTYINEHKNLDLEIKLQTVFDLLKIDKSEASLIYLESVFEDINEPLKVENFKFYQNEYPVKYLTFCDYKIDGEIIFIALSEEFLLVEKEYMIDSFLSS